MTFLSSTLNTSFHAFMDFIAFVEEAANLLLYSCSSLLDEWFSSCCFYFLIILTCRCVTVIFLCMDFCVHIIDFSGHFDLYINLFSSNLGKFWYLFQYFTCHILLFSQFLVLSLHICWYALFYKSLRLCPFFVQSFPMFFRLDLLLTYSHKCSTFFL